MRIVARNSDDQLHETAEATHVCSTESSIDGAASAKVSIYKSSDCCDYGGVVIKLTTEEPYFLPFVRQIENGCEIHIAGDCEGGQMLLALKAALNMTP